MDRLIKVVGLIGCTVVLGLFAPMSASQAADKIITVGTGGVTGVYYPAGGSICRLVNRSRREHGLRCVVESTGGSISNLEDLRSGHLDMGIVQSDWLYHAHRGSEVFNDTGADESLRVMFALHSEPFTILVRKGSDIKSFKDLKGKKVYMGNRGSGMRATMQELMRLEGWEPNDVKNVPDIDYRQTSKALCSDDVDAVLYALGHPNSAVQQITNVCDTRIVGVSGKTVDQLIAKYPFYTHAVIPGGTYTNNPYSVKTFGVGAVLVATNRVADDVAHEFAQAVFNNLDNFKTLHPVFASLEASHMRKGAANLAPMHNGAKRYFEGAEGTTKATPSQ